MAKKTIYQLPKALQWIVSILLMLVGFGIVAPLFLKPYGLLLLPFIAPFFNLITVPFFRLIGYYKYLNPYVLSTVQTDKHYDLHNVFTFDYLLNFKWSDRGRYVQRMLLAHYFKALLTIVERIENGTLSPEVTIVGHSYFFNERTAKKLGFTLNKAPFFWVFNSALQFIELSYLYSFSQGKLALPKFWKVKRAEIKGSDLVAQKDTLEKLVSITMPKRTTQS
jgi:hypothetical protein